MQSVDEIALFDAADDLDTPQDCADFCSTCPRTVTRAILVEG